MTASSHDGFYSGLPVYDLSLSGLLAAEAHFEQVPETWHVVVTDIENSTAALNAGRHEVVNLVATGSIIAALNLSYQSGLEIPFFFGGDGATLLIPPVLLDPVMHALALHQTNTRNNFGLVLRVGQVPVTTVYAQEQGLSISRLKVTDVFSIPILLGTGLAFAERIIKGPDYLFDAPATPDDNLDLSGMECRWDRIPPEQRTHDVVSLLVVSRPGRPQAAIFKQVIDHIDRIYGTPERRNPISVARLRLKATLEKLGLEMRTKLGGVNWFYLLKTWVLTRFGPLYFRFSDDGNKYLNQLVDLTDTLVIDGRINTVISGTMQQRIDLSEALDALEAAGEITYGFYVSKDSILSCYVRDRADKHIHFVDGSDGGYTRAAGMLKQKLAKQREAG